MFGKNPIEKPEHGDGYEIRLVSGSPFFTIQGEGPYAGCAAVFLRLHGCNLRCFFCDTEFSNPQDMYHSVESIVTSICTAAPGWVKLLVITGGEPVRQNLHVLVSAMVGLGWTVQIETAGTLWQDCLRDTVIVCSPKTPEINENIYDYAHAFKYVIQDGQVDTQDGLPVTNTQVEGGKPKRLARPRPGAPVYLSPMDECDDLKNSRNLNLVSRLAQAFPYRAGVQLHKLMSLP